jgi:hypothetical protein
MAKASALVTEDAGETSTASIDGRTPRHAGKMAANRMAMKGRTGRNINRGIYPPARGNP